MRLLVYVDKFNSFTKKYLEKLLETLGNVHLDIYSEEENNYISKFENHKIILGTSEYAFKSQSPTMYSRFFEHFKNQEYDRILVVRLHHPEYFLLEAITLKCTTPIRIAFYGLNEISCSRFRKFLVPQFLGLSPNNKILIHTNDWWNDENSKILDLPKHYDKQIIFLSDPIYENPNSYREKSAVISRNSLQIEKTDIVILFFGSLFFGKGPDILLNSVKYLPTNYKILFAGNHKTINFEINSQQFDHPQVVLLDRFINEMELASIFDISNLICLPYRRSYENGTSGVMVQSALARKPVLVPNFPPFSHVIDKYKFGAVFTPENSESLASAIIDFKWGKINLNCADDYVASLNSWETIAESYTLGLS